MSGIALKVDYRRVLITGALTLSPTCQPETYPGIPGRRLSLMVKAEP